MEFKVIQRRNRMDKIRESIDQLNVKLASIERSNANENQKMKLRNTCTNLCIISIILEIGEEYQQRNIPNPISPELIVDLFFPK